MLPLGGKATTVYGLDFTTLAKLSEKVVVAHVTSVRTVGQRTPRQIETLIELEIKECLRGDCPPTIQLRQLGGQFTFDDGVYTQKISGLPQYAVGEKVVLFLERTDTARLVVTGLAQGKFSVLGDGEDAAIVRSLEGLNLVAPKGRFKPKVREHVAVPQRLDVLRLMLMQLKPVLDIRPVRVPVTGAEP